MSGVESVVDATAGLSLEAIRWPSDKELFHTILTADEKRALLKDGLIYVVYHYSRAKRASAESEQLLYMPAAKWYGVKEEMALLFTQRQICLL